MPVSVVVGGQYGSEGKGKVALEMVRRDPSIVAVARPGGTNSGHTGYDNNGRKIILRQFPVAALDGNVSVIFPAGSYIDAELFLAELSVLGLREDQVLIDRRAQLILPDHKGAEVAGGLVESIGSTGSGTGAAVMSRIARNAPGTQRAISVEEDPRLVHFVRDVPDAIDTVLASRHRVLIEGTQGFGLSILHGTSWPKATSRDTTASAFLSECGIPPSVVDEVVLVLRTFPIRVAGDSGPLFGETTWSQIQESSGSEVPLDEFTSVTKKLRRVGKFDPSIVRQAIRANAPTRIILNHLDYVDAQVFESKSVSDRVRDYVGGVSYSIGRPVTEIGTGPKTLTSVSHTREFV
jgi:adenylosuccinate synthase